MNDSREHENGPGPDLDYAMGQTQSMVDESREGEHPGDPDLVKSDTEVTKAAEAALSKEGGIDEPVEEEKDYFFFRQYSSRHPRMVDPSNIVVSGAGRHGYVISTSDGGILGELSFQDGPPLVMKTVKDKSGHVVGEEFQGFEWNGVTVESLIAVCINRLEYLDGLQECGENHDALDALKLAMSKLNLRTSRRERQGVEGKQVPHVAA